MEITVVNKIIQGQREPSEEINFIELNENENTTYQTYLGRSKGSTKWKIDSTKSLGSKTKRD